MPRTVAEGFDELLRRIPPTEAVTDKLKQHRDSIETCLRRNFRVTNFFRVGSFGHGTNIPRHSDVDFFMVQAEDEWPENSGLALREVKTALANRFWATDVRVSSPAVLVPFGLSSTERFEITPAFIDDDRDHHETFYIPDREGGWMLAAPRAHNAYTNEVNEQVGRRAKPLIRLIKLWNAECQAGLRSIYLELRIARRLQDIDRVTYSVEVANTLDALLDVELRALQDPIGLTGRIEPCSAARRPQALTRLARAAGRAQKALDAEDDGDVRAAFYWWRRLFNGNFPAYR
jgi:Second Messenger Oligonucleotide or Dinucleotide Synthetase domain